MRGLLCVVTFVAGCAASSTPEQRMAKAGPIHDEPPRGSIEKSRTRENLDRPPASLPPATRDEPIGPLRDIPPVPVIP
jgi:hypothetical protein